MQVLSGTDTEHPSFTAWTTRVSNPVCSPRFRVSASVTVQMAAFATGVPSDIYEFHLYTGNSAILSGTLARQYRVQFRGWAPGFHIRLTWPPTRALRPVIPNNACALRITAAAGTELAGASFGGTVTPGPLFEAGYSSPLTVVYNPKAVIPHAASLCQPCGHCAIFPTAASRRSLGRISVPMWLAILSDQLPVIALVGRYPANELIGREPLHLRLAAFLPRPCSQRSVCGITRPL